PARLAHCPARSPEAARGRRTALRPRAAAPAPRPPTGSCPRRPRVWTGSRGTAPRHSSASRIRRSPAAAASWLATGPSPTAPRSRRGATAGRFPLPRSPTPPRHGSRRSGASPWPALPPGAPRRAAPAAPRAARRARAAAAPAVPRAAPVPYRARSAAPEAPPRPCLSPPAARRRASAPRRPPGLTRARTKKKPAAAGPASGSSATASSPGRLLRIRLLLHRLVGLRADPYAGMGNRDHEPFGHAQRLRVVRRQGVAPLGRELCGGAQRQRDGIADAAHHRVLDHVGEWPPRRVAQLGERHVTRGG